MRRISLIFLIIILLFFGCTKVIDIDLPDHESKLVINSMFKPSERIHVNISKSRSLNDTSPEELFTKTITLWCNDTLVETKATASSIYVSPDFAKESNKYRIEISVPGYETIKASDTVPPKTLITQLEHKKSVWINENGHMFSQLKIHFTDQPEIKNYYELKLTVSKPHTANPSMREYENAWFGGLPDPALKEFFNYWYEIRALIFDDKLFNGTDYLLELLYAFPNNDVSEYELILEFNSVSRSYFEYKKQLGAYRKAAETNIFLGAPEPVNLFSNVNNGYGIFAAYSTDRKVLNISK